MFYGKHRTKEHGRRNTTQYQLIVSFMTILTVTVGLLSIAIVGMTMVSLYQSVENQGDVMLDTLTQSNAKDQEDWWDTLSAYVGSDDTPYLIRVALPTEEIMYSSDAETVFQDFSEMKQLLFLENVLWSDDGEPYYYAAATINGASVVLLIDCEDTFEVITQIIFFTILINVVMLIAGALIVFHLSRKLSQSLRALDREINQLETNIEDQALYLTEPEKPQEIKNIAQSFNHLLEQQRAAMAREQQFVTDASHELRTPLAAIRGHVNLIKRRGQEHPEVIEKSVGFIDKESKRMEVLVQQLLTLGRLAKKQDEVDLSQLLTQMMEEMQVMIPQQTEVDIEEQLFAVGSREHFYQIIRNLLENAAKYTPADGQITIQLKKLENQAVLRVSDTGIGIAAEEKKKIFERFYRIDQSRSSEIAGSGIGLSIVNELIQLYDGKITVQDVQPQGTCFTVALPLRNDRQLQ